MRILIIKSCTKCQQEKAREQFDKRSSARDGLQSHCKACRSAASKNIPQEKKAITYAKRAVKISLKKEEHRAKWKESRERNKDYRKQWREENRSRLNALMVAWKAANPAKVKAIDCRRRGRMSNGSHSAGDILKILAAQNLACRYCSADLSDGYHIDHRIPLCLGGSNWPENLQALCAPCNLSKGGKHPDVFEAQIGFVSNELVCTSKN